MLIRREMSPTPVGGSNALTANLAQPGGRGEAQVVLPTIPFVRAADEQTIDTGIDVSRALTASTVTVGSFEIPATGFLRGIWLYVELTGGVDGLNPMVAQADAPWSIINQITLRDPAGNQIVGPLTGYSLYLANFVGGYQYLVDPINSGAYDALDTDGNGSFMLWVPVEASARDGYASLVNSDSSASYVLEFTQAPASAVFSTEPDTLPTVRWKAWVEVWTQPTATNLQGQPQAQNPPGLGTVQYWTREITTLTTGDNKVRVRRVGNLIRNLVTVTRNSSGARVAVSLLPDPVQWLYDSLLLSTEGRILRQAKQKDMLGTQLPIGVQLWSFCNDLDGKPGFELRNALLPTTPATRLENHGIWGAVSGGSLEVLINDIYPQGLS